ncbi:putative bifunctional diguanylate cyclase/phosphodiesterase [Cellulosilyticum ruminicola]|uniref:putative bifunctional diguanylate cyclase/phosphodiesterase n=1 Tax=Cellulosilyticum ruminicola TaxID=425254 RepID=UPI0006D1FE52|nr:GGDEF domain-containing phosphodiesterase [Cellulosilyticum ruminicola]
MRKNKNKIKYLSIKYMGLGLYVLTFLLLTFSIIVLNFTASPIIDLGYFVYNRSALSGLITQLQVLTLILIVVFFDTIGYITCLILCVVAALGNLMPIIHTKNYTSITGIITFLGVTASTTIIYQYSRQLKLKISETLLQKEKLNEIAFYDALTGLANRRRFLKTLDELITSDPEKKSHFSIVFIDVDDFKKINDTAGHQKGDEILIELASCLQDYIHPDDLLGRLGGDEFALIIKSLQNHDDILTYTNHLKDIILTQLNVQSNPFFISASFGIAVYPTDATSSEELLKYADTAMYSAKLAGKNQVVYFNQQMHTALVYKTNLENYLKNAVQNDELYLVYQPQYTVGNKELRGFECLIRWQSPELGAVAPSTFIPVAEDTGLIISIGEWILYSACATFKSLMDYYHFKPIISVNISVIQMIDTNFLKMVKKVLADTHFPPECLEFEITESIFISSKEYVIRLLNELRDMGIHIALDDFGTTYASLSYLQILPLDIIKIDKSFIDSIVSSKKQEHLVEAIISIAQKLDYKVVAEGIEDITQLNLLKSHGCDYIQGYLWGRPLDYETLTGSLPDMIPINDSYMFHDESC